MSVSADYRYPAKRFLSPQVKGVLTMLESTIRERFERRFNAELRKILRQVADEQGDAGLLDHELAYATMRFIISKGLDPTEYMKRRDERQRLHLGPGER